MSETSQDKSGTYADAVTAVSVAHRAVVNGEAAVGRRMVDAGLALIDAIARGAVTFDRVTGKEATAVRATGVLTKSDLAKRLGTSGTMLTKYAAVGLAVCAGVTPENTERSDWIRFTQAAAAKWATEAVATQDAEIIRKAITDHRPGATKGDQKNGQTSKRKATPAAAKTEPEKITARNVEAEVARVNRWLTAHPGAVKGESRDTMIALLREAADALEAAAHKNAGPVALAEAV